jgi:protein involved in polysaccharide export with SLBB domain
LKNVPDRVWTVPLLAGVVRSAIQNSTPEQITGLVLTASDLTSVSVEWSAEVNSAEYNVYVDDELFITVLETGASSVILTGLTAGTEYTVNVSGVNAVGVEGALSATLTVETEGLWSVPSLTGPS